MPAGNCYTNTLQPLNPKHQALLREVYPAGIERIYGNLADVRRKRDNETWPDYMNDVIEHLPDGIRLWRNDEGQDHVFNGALGEGSFKNLLLMCKITDRIPLTCWGHNEEQNSWLSRNPINHLDFLENFCKYFAIYLREKLGFIQAHIEIFNEPQKGGCMPNTDDYAKVCIAMAKGFKQYPNFKVHVGSNDINVDVDSGYAASVIPQVKGKVDYYSSHALWPHQHKKGYMAKLNQLLAGSGIKQSITEFSPDGDWSSFNELVDNGIEIYCLLFAFRRDFFGDVFDDIRIFTREARPELNLKSGDWLPNGFNQEKYLKLIEFNRKYYSKQLPIEEEFDDMKLDKIYKAGSKGIGVKFVQKVINAELMPEPLLIEDGIWGAKTTVCVKDYQKLLGLVQDGIVGEKTMKSMIDNYPEIWNEIEYEWCIGVR